MCEALDPVCGCLHLASGDPPGQTPLQNGNRSSEAWLMVGLYSSAFCLVALLDQTLLLTCLQSGLIEVAGLFDDMRIIHTVPPLCPNGWPTIDVRRSSTG